MSKNRLVCVDCESDGGYMPDYSIVCFAAIIVEPSLSKTFYGKMRPISNQYNPEALAISGFSREEHLGFDEPEKIMKEFAEWLKINVSGQPIGISDNNGYDFGVCLNYYFHKFYGSNPFGWSSRRIGDLFCGAEHDMWYKWKKHRITEHNHDSRFDVKGNAEALLYLSKTYNIKLP
jgi:hypothetical protein